MLSFKWRHFKQDNIFMLVRWYLAYALSYRDVEELALERGLKVDHSTINRWVIDYSSQLEEINRFKDQVKKTFKSKIGKDSCITFLLAVMEIEAWILSEFTHLKNIHKDLTLERISSQLGLDLQNEDLSLREQPSMDLSDIYWLESIEYDKSKKLINHIVNSIDKKHMYEVVRYKFPDLNTLYCDLEDFFQD